MKFTKEDEYNIHNYSAVFDAKCGRTIHVWKDKNHPNQNQLKEHEENCIYCKVKDRNKKLKSIYERNVRNNTSKRTSF